MRNQYHHIKIKKIINHNENLKSFVFDYCFDFIAGQFVMVWLPGIDEKPISLSSDNMITVKKLGVFTQGLFKKKEGDYLDIRGPYGNGFPDSKSCILIGGGCGIAPLLNLVFKKNSKVSTFIMGGRTKSDFIFLDKLKKSVKNIIIATQDGSCGIKGLITDVNIPKTKKNYYICGPEIMMKAVAEKLINLGINQEQIYLSLERYMKCGIGICGSCSCSGYRICADGPIFRYDKIKNLSHFNKAGRTRTGELKKY
ncbi:MAG: dihydroorotate dehydrogenase electron transfer subunit [bacterium]|nr:dihydroorotate dehydrogenase electron transfer subunit [bacterium]